VQIEACEKRIPAQKCPYCGELQDVIVQGLEDMPDVPDGKMVVEDKGYSFCNCRNIFFTNWENMHQEIYDEAYQQKYPNVTAELLLRGKGESLENCVKLVGNKGHFLEIGCSYSYILDKARELGMQTYGANISKVSFDNHPVKVCDFEKEEFFDKYDVIYSSHVFEHFKDPIEAAQKCYDMLNEGGVLFVAMPDPFFIDWGKPYLWGHWHIKEHHILWDMDSFCEEMEKLGFKTVDKQRNMEGEFIYCAEMFLTFQKEKKHGF
jgi:SAM-dependent methyltransferase